MKITNEIENNIRELKSAFLGSFITQGIAVACEFCIFDCFETLETVLSLKELARKVKANPCSIKKLLNFLVAIELLCIFSDRESYKLTLKGSLLKRDGNPSLHYYALLHSSVFFKSSIDLLYKSIKYNKYPSFYLCKKGPYGFLEKNSRDNFLFNKAMGSLSNIYADEISAFINTLNYRTILDAGGGIGALLCLILKNNSSAIGYTLDLPALKKEALAHIKKSKLSKRVFFIGQDFFKEFHTKSDIIIFHNIMYDYDDSTCVSILKNSKKSINKEGSILVIETLLSSDSESSRGGLKDLFMHVITLGGRVRSQQDFQSIFNMAGLKIDQIYRVGLTSNITIIRLLPMNLSQ